MGSPGRLRVALAGLRFGGAFVPIYLVFGLTIERNLAAILAQGMQSLLFFLLLFTIPQLVLQRFTGREGR